MTRFPAEWEPQAAVLIAWPHDSGDFSQRLEAVEHSYKIITETITQYQHLIIVCRDADHQLSIQDQLSSLENIFFVKAEVNDIWVRDTVFLTVEQDDQLILLNFKFNGWGGKYSFYKDDALNHILLKSKPFQNKYWRDIDFVLEGGSVESDGQGTLMTTRQCLLNPNRNKNLNQIEIEAQLLDNFGVTRILWLDQEHLAGDDTDAHIDTLARFCSVETIAYTSCEDTAHPHFASLLNMQSQLKALRKADGSPYHLVPLPLPETIFDEENQALPANYSNFLIINGAVLVPVYDDSMDEVALQRLKECFPDRKIIAIPARPLVHQYGSLHCMTMQFPAQSLDF